MKLDLGCGNVPKDGYVGVDLYAWDENSAVIREDCLSFIRNLKNDSVESVYSRHFFEHVTNDYITELIQECNRVLKPGGTLEIIVPHFSNPYFYSDPTHKSYFGVYTFAYLVGNNIFRRKVPMYRNTFSQRLELREVKVKLFPSFFIMNIIKKGLQIRCNSSTNAIEFHERYLLSFFPIYELKYLICKGF